MSRWLRSITQRSMTRRDLEWIDVRFGFRRLNDGETCLAVFAPDLFEKSRTHIDRWRPYYLENPEWLDFESDTRFSRWVHRYIDGEWGVDSGPDFRLLREITLINGLTREAVGLRLFKHEDVPISMPGAPNTHRYEEAHRELYGTADRRTREGVHRPHRGRASAASLGRRARRHLQALTDALPELAADEAFNKPLDGSVSSGGLRAIRCGLRLDLWMPSASSRAISKDAREPSHACVRSSKVSSEWTPNAAGKGRKRLSACPRSCSRTQSPLRNSI